MKLQILFASCLFLNSSVALAETSVPEGVRYIEASAALNKAAREKLLFILKSKEQSIMSLLGKGTLADQLTLVGPFLSKQLLAINPATEAKFLKVDTRIPIGNEIVATIKSIGLRNDEERALFSSMLPRTGVLRWDATVRKLTAEEMSLIWMFIGWDIEEPTFVIEAGQKRLVVSIRPDNGVLRWIEEISEPCVQANAEGKTTPCYCFGRGWADADKCAQ